MGTLRIVSAPATNVWGVSPAPAAFSAVRSTMASSQSLSMYAYSAVS